MQEGQMQARAAGDSLCWRDVLPGSWSIRGEHPVLCAGGNVLLCLLCGWGHLPEWRELLRSGFGRRPRFVRTLQRRLLHQRQRRLQHPPFPHLLPGRLAGLQLLGWLPILLCGRLARRLLLRRGRLPHLLSGRIGSRLLPGGIRLL